MSKIVTTDIKETVRGHEITFTIGVQTFSLREVYEDEDRTSEEYARWYEHMLEKAFNNYERLLKEELKEDIRLEILGKTIKNA